MALNSQRIDIDQVNTNNFNNVKSWAQQRLNVVKDLESQIGGLTQNLSTAREIPEFQELEKLVSSLCSNVKQYLKVNQREVDQFAKEAQQAQAQYEATKSEVEGTNTSTSTLVNDKDEGKRMFKECLAAVDTYVDQISPQTLAKQNPSEAAKIHFDKLFVWVLDFVYDCGSNKYDWKNFSRQAFTLDGGIDFKNRMKGLDYKKFTPYQIEAAKRIVGLKNLLAREINSSDINSLLAAIEQMARAGEYRLQYKAAQAQLASNAKSLGVAKIKIDVHKNIAGITRDSLDISRQVRDKVSILSQQLATTFAAAPANTEYRSEVIQQEVQAEQRAPIDPVPEQAPALEDSIRKDAKAAKPDRRDQEETDAKPRKMKLDELKETIPEAKERTGACGDGDCCLI